MSAQQIEDEEGRNMIGVSYDGDGKHPLPVAWPCSGCGDVWKRGNALDTGGARYFLRGMWMCGPCCYEFLAAEATAARA